METEKKMENEMDALGPFEGYAGILLYPNTNGESNRKEHGI